MQRSSNFKFIFMGILVSLTALACAHVNTVPPLETKSLKYVFFFIGDGMANVQVHATEAYRAALEQRDEVGGSTKTKLLTLSTLPVLGMQTTFAHNRLVTGSAAAGTALATGMKTDINVISKGPDLKSSYKSIAEAAKSKGMKVGILSSVPINHATPAVFYAHTDVRRNYHDIAMQLAYSHFDFFGGGYWAKNGETEPGGAEEAAVLNGFTLTHTLDDLKTQLPGTRVIAFDLAQDAGGHTGALRYEIDRRANHISLAQFTEQAIRLMNNPKGFFMMVEGGKIDWACHANDARTAFEDIIAFDAAVDMAVAFAETYPDETLIVVTADHECGGLAIGNNTTKYDTSLELLAGQKISHEAFDTSIVPSYRQTHDPMPENIDKDMWQIILANFGLDGAGLTVEKKDDLSAQELRRLETAFDKSFAAAHHKEKTRYAQSTPLGIALLHILNTRAGLSWGSQYHTAVPVPVFAMGAGAEMFSGFYDNTEIPKKMAKALGISLD